jgi:hypothetical protein
MSICEVWSGRNGWKGAIGVAVSSPCQQAGKSLRGSQTSWWVMVKLSKAFEIVIRLFAVWKIAKGEQKQAEMSTYRGLPISRPSQLGLPIVHVCVPMALHSISKHWYLIYQLLAYQRRAWSWYVHVVVEPNDTGGQNQVNYYSITQTTRIWA